MGKRAENKILKINIMEKNDQKHPSACLGQNGLFTEVSLNYLNSIIENRRPIGKFYCHNTKDPIEVLEDSGYKTFKEDDDLFIAVDNLTGDAWTEEFDTYKQMMSWFS